MNQLKKITFEIELKSIDSKLSINKLHNYELENLRNQIEFEIKNNMKIERDKWYKQTLLSGRVEECLENFVASSLISVSIKEVDL